MTSPTFVICFMLLVVRYIAQTVDQKLSTSVHHETRGTGENVTLPCVFKEDSSNWSYWFKQTGENLRPISAFDKYTTTQKFLGEFQNNLRFKLDGKNDKNDLIISHLEVSDAGIYHCISFYTSSVEVLATITVSVKGSGVSVPALVHQSESETIQPGGSVTLNCTVHSQTYDCAVVSCGDRTKLDSGDEVSSGVLVYSLSGALISAVILIVVLAFLLYKMNKRICFLSQEIQARFSAPSTTNMEGNRGADDVCYAAVNVNMPNTSRRQRNTARDECVYSSVRQ